MDTVYHYVGFVVVWFAILLVIAAAAFCLCFLIAVACRRSWIYEAYQVVKTWYYYEYIKTHKADMVGLRMVEKGILSKKWWQNPFRSWWLSFIKRYREQLKHSTMDGDA